MKGEEYKDTFTFKLFPEYTYTIAQRKRFRLFQGRVEHWKAAVNYADKFSDQSEINLVYMIGYSKRIRPYVQNTNNNVVVLCADIPKELLKIYDQYWELVSKLCKSGMATEDGNISDVYIRDRDALLRYYGENADNETVRTYIEERRIISGYEQLRGKIGKYFDRYIIVDKLHPEKTISHNDLDRIIKRYFPRGREQCGVGEKVYKSLKTIDLSVVCGLDGKECDAILQNQTDTPMAKLCETNIKRCMMNINVAFREKGWINLAELFAEMQNPPYGWSSDAHAAYCFGAAVRRLGEDLWIYDSCNILQVKECAANVITAIVKGYNLRRRTFILFNESGWRLSNRFAYIFGIQAKVPFAKMVHDVIRQIRESTRFPVSVIDDKLREVICGGIELFTTADIKEFIRYFDWGKCEEIRDKYLTMNEWLPQIIMEKYQNVEDKDLEIRCTTSESGWLWDAEMFWSTVSFVNDNGGECYQLRKAHRR